MVKGLDIMLLWVERMMMMGINLMEEIKLNKVYMNEIVRKKNGEKMQKQKGKVIENIEMMEEYGEDELRLKMEIMEEKGSEVKIDKERIEG